MAESVIEIKIGDVEVRCRGVDAGLQLDDVLRALKRHLGERFADGVDASAAPSPAELLAASRARTFGDRAGIVAYWLQTWGGRARWRSGEIVSILREAGEPVPSNITDALNQKAKKGLFEVADRMWRLTDEGAGWVKYSLLRQETGTDPDS